MRCYIIRCDAPACENSVNFPEEVALPHHWLSLVRTSEETRHFCSLHCLQRAINGVIGLPLTQDTPHEPYPYCCSKHYPLPKKSRGEKK